MRQTRQTVLSVLAGLAALSGALVGGGVAAAAGPVEARVTGVENKFPDELVFSVQAESTAGEVRSVTLRSVVGSGPAERRANVDIQPGRQVRGTLTYKTGGTNFIAAGADITYWLEVQDAAGNRFETEKAVYWYEDTRFQWSNLKEGGVTVYYYGPAQGAAQNVLRAARETQTKVGNMLGVSARPFRVMLYNTPRDITGAQTPELSETRRAEIIRAGVAYSGEDVVQVLAGGGGGADTARHEIAHLFVHWSAGNSVPAWLNEGLAVWAQSDGGQEYVPYFQRALRNNELLLIRGMESFPGKPEETLLAYGQSYNIVKWLIDTQGPEKFRALFETLKAGGGLAAALQQQYGVTADQLDARWRESVGAPPRNYDTAVPTAIAMPTIAPLGAAPSPPQPQPSGGGGGGAAQSGGVPPYLLVGAAVAVVLLVVVGGAAVFKMGRRGS